MEEVGGSWRKLEKVSAGTSAGTTILSDQLASLSTGLEAKSRLLEAKSRGFRSLEAWKNLGFFYSKIMEIKGNPSNY